MTWYAVVGVAAALIIGNAFFVAVEFALLAARRGRMRRVPVEGESADQQNDDRGGENDPLHGMRIPG